MDMLPITLNAMSRLDHLYKDIDFYYYSNAQLYSSTERSTEIEQSEFYKALPEQHKLYYRKLYAIFTRDAAEEGDSMDWLINNQEKSTFLKLLTKGFKRIHQVIKKQPEGAVISLNDIPPLYHHIPYP